VSQGGPSLILIFGMPRSGTTWLGKIFDSHPDTLYRHEPDKWHRCAEVPKVLPWALAEGRQAAVRGYLDEVLALRHVAVSGKPPVFPKSYYSPLTYGLRQATVLAARLGRRITRHLALPEFVDGARSRVHLVWKSTNSVCRLGTFLRLLDGARAVHLVRHPCGQIASILRGNALGIPAMSRLPSEHRQVLQALVDSDPGRAHGLSFDELMEMPALERMTWMWVISTELALAETDRLNGCVTVTYEDLCRDPAGEVQALFEFCRLPWNEGTERFIQLQRWREQLEPDEIERILAIARESPRARRFVEAESAVPLSPRPALAL
jgi:hypothetical protein